MTFDFGTVPTATFDFGTVPTIEITEPEFTTESNLADAGEEETQKEELNQEFFDN